MRSWIFNFSIATISQRNELDHTFDHLRRWTTWKQCLQEHPKAPISDSKAPKSLVNQAKNRLFSVWEHDVAGSNPVIPTKKEKIALAVVFSFFAWCVNSVLFCRAKAGSHTVGITKRSEVTLSFRPFLVLYVQKISLFRKN